MNKPRTHALKLTLADGGCLRTSTDVAYAWVKLGAHEGWTRAPRPDEHRDAPRLLIPKTFDRQRSAALLDSTPRDLQSTDLEGALLVLPGDGSPAGKRELDAFREARIDHQPQAVNDVVLARASTAELLDLVSAHGISVAARALQLRSLPAREELLAHLGHSRVAELLAQHTELPEEVVWQTMRSRGFNPEGSVELSATDAAGLAGNPNLSAERQVWVVNQLLGKLADGSTDVEAPLSRAAAAPTLPEQAAMVLSNTYDRLPARVRLALANNSSATWLWLRRRLDGDTDPRVALASREVGEISAARSVVFTQHPDPEVRTAGGVNLPQVTWSWEDPNHQEVLRLVDDPFSTGHWSLEPESIPASDWGAHSVARQWAARTEQHPDAERELRRLVDLHNRSWGAVGRGQGDPARAARADAARAVATLTPAVQLLGLDPGRSYSLEDARLAAVQATAARTQEELVDDTSPVTRAVLDACAAEAEAHR